MSSYTINITPDEQTHAVSTVRVEVSPTGTRITELVVRSGSAEGLTPQQLPLVDLELLLRAVNPATANSFIKKASAPAEQVAAQADPAAQDAAGVTAQAAAPVDFVAVAEPTAVLDLA